MEKNVDKHSFSKTSSRTTVGDCLFNYTSEFYSWYMSLVDDSKSQSGVFRALSQLMRIALLSAEGGNYLKMDTEEKALRSLTLLKENLSDGNLKHGEVLHQLKKIINEITSNNPKARLVTYATEIEYTYCIEKNPSNQIQEFQQYLKELLNFVTPSLLEIHAYAIAQIMGKVLENPTLFADPKTTLKEEINKWLPSAYTKP